MKNKTRNSKTTGTSFQSGQIWQLADSHLRIGLVGKTLVHYKHFKGMARTSPVFLSGKDTLERFLQEHRAILLPARTDAAKRRPVTDPPWSGRSPTTIRRQARRNHL